MLRILGLLDKPTRGEYTINNLNVVDLPEEERNYYRLTQLGYVFQDYALINEMSASENVYILLLMEENQKKNLFLLPGRLWKKSGLGINWTGFRISFQEEKSRELPLREP